MTLYGGVVRMAVAAGVLVTAFVSCESDVRLKTEEDRVAYSIGYSVGTNLAKTLEEQSEKPDTKMLLAGLEAALAGTSLVITDQEMMQTLTDYAEKKQKEAEAERARLAVENKEKGDAFLAKNKSKEGVKTLPSGLQYRVVEEGSGDTPSSTDKALVHYVGRFLDGEQFDSSRDRNAPVDFPVNRVIAGWQEILQMMQVGDKWEVWVPGNLAYGDRGTPDIPPNSTLWFEIELLDVTKTPAASK